jgi:hypothetical protein
MKIHDYTNPFRSRAFYTKPSGSFGGLNRKNPFRGIACASPRNASDERHIEGARDTRPTFQTHYRDQCYRALVDPAVVIPEHFDSNPIPCAFLQ